MQITTGGDDPLKIILNKIQQIKHLGKLEQAFTSNRFITHRTASDREIMNGNPQ